MLIKNASALLGDGLRYVPRTCLRTEDRRFSGIGEGLRPDPGEEVLDGEGLLAIPGLVNCHTHIGDSIGKDVAAGASVDGRIHPVFGAKSRILSRTDPVHLVSFMEGACRSMLQRGITTFVDFREGGPDGIALLKRAVSSVPIRAVVLGRVDRHHTARQVRAGQAPPPSMTGEVRALLKGCDGLGISGANENSSPQLRLYSRAGRIRAVHAAETQDSTKRSTRITGRSEVVRALEMRPHFLVHMTHATRRELVLAAKRTRGIVICPRANAALAEGMPDIELMRGSGCRLALGTDNVMVNPPDMFREMDYIWKATMGLKRHRVDPRLILQMATVNAGRLLRRNVGVIGRGRLADAVFLDKHAVDLEPMHDPHASVVHRASETAIRAVMVGGEIVHGKI